MYNYYNYILVNIRVRACDSVASVRVMMMCESMRILVLVVCEFCSNIGVCVIGSVNCILVHV